MKAIEIITRKDFIFNPNLVKFTAKEDKVIADISIIPEEEVECWYYWYDHLTRGSKAVKDIETALNTHNWRLFEQYLYNEVPHHCTLPYEMVVFSKMSGEILGHLALSKETMPFIQHSEYECG